ncbi:DUF7261 family protein [Halomarina oriensis]|uniref:Uncharacterized protein n=1 Tax=Halomarina oriensis TaxID=671145 RepID=A0A6B0GXQ4_9EURY|nr:hypothetical protein [Halomarina oriensis]MWG36915.1 hypothetical protein [Halomarina oriensis]
MSDAERRDRAQFVLAAAAVVAVALAPAVLASLQLGYHPDVAANDDYDDPLADAERLLSRSVHEAGTNATGANWSDRAVVVERVRADLAPRIRTLEASRTAEGVAYRVGYDESAASAWAREHCPGGSGRAFGPCEATDGVVLQERAGETTVVAVAFDVRVTTGRGAYDATMVVRVVD